MNKDPITIHTYFCPECGRSCESKGCRIEQNGLLSKMYCSECDSSKVILSGTAVIFVGLMISMGISIVTPLSGSQAPALFMFLSFLFFGLFRIGKQITVRRGRKRKSKSVDVSGL